MNKSMITEPFPLQKEHFETLTRKNNYTYRVFDSHYNYEK